MQSLTMAEVARGIVNSEESVLRAIDSYYSVFLHRPGEVPGRDIWFSLLRRQPNLVGAVGEMFLFGTNEVAEYFTGALAAAHGVILI
jgi:hypothetical protein